MSTPSDQGGSGATRRGSVGLLSPLRQRDFALLWVGTTVSLIGDGIYFVAVAWEAYSLSNAPTALSVVGVAWTLPTVVFLIVGGALTDRLERRRLLLIASAAEAIAIGAIGLLAIAGDLRLWMLLVLVAVYGAAEAFFNPAFTAIIPTLVDPDELTAASALDQFVRPLAGQILGPAIGGVVVAIGGTGVAFLIDAATFVAPIVTLRAMRRPATVEVAVATTGRALSEIAEGFRFVRGNPWLWATLLAASLSLLAFVGPVQVLLPYLVKNALHGGDGMFGAIRAASGAGAILTAVGVARTGIPRRFITVMFVAWASESLLLIAFAVATSAWVFALVSLVAGGLAALGNIIWATLMKTLVPNELLGRVSSFDWLVSIGLIPLSYAITGPIAQAIGIRTTLIAAGGLSAAAMIAFLGVPGLRDPERSNRLSVTGSARQPR